MEKTNLVDTTDLLHSLLPELQKSLDEAFDDANNCDETEKMNSHILQDKTNELEEKDKKIEELKRKLDEYKQSLRDVKKENEDLEQQFLHSRNTTNPLVNSMKGLPPLDEKSQREYLRQLEKESERFGPFESEKKVEEPPEVEQALKKYLLLNQSLEKVYRELQADEHKLTENSEKYTMESKENKNLKDLEKISQIQEKYMTDLKDKYNELLDKCTTIAKQEIKNLQIEICEEEKSKHTEVFNDTEILLVQNNIFQLVTDIELTNKRIETYKSRQRKLICELNRVTKQNELDEAELDELQNDLCNNHCIEQKAQEVMKHLETMIDRAEKTDCAISKSIGDLDGEICIRIQELKNLMRNRCREKQCKKQLKTSKQAVVECDREKGDCPNRDGVGFIKRKRLEEIIDEMIAQVKCV